MPDFSSILSALDRCEHGRHRQDACFSCPDRQSTGNLFLTPGTRIGTNLYGTPIIVPVQEWRRDPASWVEDGHFT